MNGILLFIFTIGGFLIFTVLAYVLASFFKRIKNTIALKKSPPVRILSNNELDILYTNNCFIKLNWFYRLLNIKPRVKTNQVYQLTGEYILLTSSFNGTIRRVIPTINSVIVQLPFDAHQMINQVKDVISQPQIDFRDFTDYDLAFRAANQLKEAQISIKMPLICDIVFTNNNKVVVINITTSHPDDNNQIMPVFDLQSANARALVHQSNLINFKNGVTGTYFDPVYENTSYKLISQRDESPIEKMVRIDDGGLISGFSYLATVTSGIVIIISPSSSAMYLKIAFSLMVIFSILTILSFFRKKLKSKVKINTIEGKIEVRRNIDPYNPHKVISKYIGGLEFGINYPLHTIFLDKFKPNQTITAEITLDSNDILGVLGWTSINAFYSKIPHPKFGTHCTRFIFGIFCTLFTFYLPINTSQMLETLVNQPIVENTRTTTCYQNSLDLNWLNTSSDPVNHFFYTKQNKDNNKCTDNTPNGSINKSATELYKQLSAYAFAIILIFNIFFLVISGLLACRHYKLKKVLDEQKSLYFEILSKK